MKFAENLKKVIQDRGIKITTISEETGIPLSTLSEWTAGREPKVSEALVRLSKYLNVSLDNLVLGHEATASSHFLTETIIDLNGQQYCLKIYNHKTKKQENA